MHHQANSSWVKLLFFSCSKFSLNNENFKETGPSMLLDFHFIF